MPITSWPSSVLLYPWKSLPHSLQKASSHRVPSDDFWSSLYSARLPVSLLTAAIAGSYLWGGVLLRLLRLGVDSWVSVGTPRSGSWAPSVEGGDWCCGGMPLGTPRTDASVDLDDFSGGLTLECKSS